MKLCQFIIFRLSHQHSTLWEEALGPSQNQEWTVITFKFGYADCIRTNQASGNASRIIAILHLNDLWRETQIFGSGVI